MITRRGFLAALLPLTASLHTRVGLGTTATERVFTQPELVRVRSLLQTVEHLRPDSTDAICGRIESISAALLDKPFRWNPVGEGAGHPDGDPVFTTLRFDCLTFVESVIALARSTTPEEVAQDILALRYVDGVPDFTGRTHFMSCDWLPNSLARRIVQDRTSWTAPAAGLGSIAYSVNKRAWWGRLKTHPRYGAQGTQVSWSYANEMAPPASIPESGSCSGRIRYMRLDGEAWPTSMDAFFSGAVLLMVRPDSPYHHGTGATDPFSHCGLAIRNGGEWVLRAASLTRRAVVDVPLRRYLTPGSSGSRPIGVVVLGVVPRSR